MTKSATTTEEPAVAAVTLRKIEVISQGEIDPRELVIDEQSNGRRYPAKVQEMVRSMLQDGQEQPITTRLEGGQHHVVFGFRRARAGVQIVEQNLQKGFKLRYQTVNMTPEEAWWHNVVENAAREDTSAIDNAHNYQRLKGAPYLLTQREIALRLGVSDALISRTLSLLTCTAKVQRLIHAGKIPIEAGYELAGMPPEEQEARAQALASGEKITAAEIRQSNRKQDKEGRDKARSLTAKAIRMPFEAVVAKWPADQEPTPYVAACELITRLCRGEVAAKTALRKLRDLLEA